MRWPWLRWQSSWRSPRLELRVETDRQVLKAEMGSPQKSQVRGQQGVPPQSTELRDTRKQLFAGGVKCCLSWLMGQASPSLETGTLCAPQHYCHPIIIAANGNKLSMPGREDILALQALLSVLWLTPLLQLNSETHVLELEDNLSEANAWLEKSQAEINAIRLRGKFLNSFVQSHLPLILLFLYISSGSGSPALSPLANLPHPSSLYFSLQAGWISSSPASLCTVPTAECSHLSWEHEEAQSKLNQTVHIKISLTS